MSEVVRASIADEIALDIPVTEIVFPVMLILSPAVKVFCYR